MNLSVFYKDDGTYCVDFELSFNNPTDGDLVLQWPVWRPGRYSTQDFVKNLMHIRAESGSESIRMYKTEKDRWLIKSKGYEEIRLRYRYYAKQFDAGGCLSNNEMLYLNWVCCVPYLPEAPDEAIEVQLHIPDSFKISCALDRKGKTLFASSHTELTDSPMIAAAEMQHFSYSVKNSSCKFHIWIWGDWMPDAEKLLNDFIAFTEVQIELFGKIPCREYHFQLLIPPYKAFHGVEHKASTVILLGPGNTINQLDNYNKLLGIASHELFHVWNAKSFAPAEITPYDLSKETNFKTGYIIEGITTLYGDLMLLRSGVWSEQVFFEELNRMLLRHSLNFGRYNLSVADSSYDLWLDGYEAGAPNRKVSIYVEGALTALVLDILIRKRNKGEKSLDDLLRWLFAEKQESGYTEDDIRLKIQELGGEETLRAFQQCLYETGFIEEYLKKWLPEIGLCLNTVSSSSIEDRIYGFAARESSGKLKVIKIIPNSPAFGVLSADDELIALNGRKIENDLSNWITAKQAFEVVELTLFRNHDLMTVRLEADGKSYFSRFEVIKDIEANAEVLLAYHKFRS